MSLFEDLQEDEKKHNVISEVQNDFNNFVEMLMVKIGRMSWSRDFKAGGVRHLLALDMNKNPMTDDRSLFIACFIEGYTALSFWETEITKEILKKHRDDLGLEGTLEQFTDMFITALDGTIHASIIENGGESKKGESSDAQEEEGSKKNTTPPGQHLELKLTYSTVDLVGMISLHPVQTDISRSISRCVFNLPRSQEPTLMDATASLRGGADKKAASATGTKGGSKRVASTQPQAEAVAGAGADVPRPADAPPVLDSKAEAAKRALEVKRKRMAKGNLLNPNARRAKNRKLG